MMLMEYNDDEWWINNEWYEWMMMNESINNDK